MLGDLAWRFFPPNEVKLIREAIDLFLDAHTKISKGIISAGAHEQANDKQKILYAIRIEHMKPDEIALTLIARAICHEIQGGRHHMHFGLLNQVGREMVDVCYIIGKKMLERGYRTEAQVKRDNDLMHELEFNGGF